MKIEPTRTRKEGTKVTLAKTGADIVAACRAIVAAQQYAKINGVMVDLFSASAVVKVFDALNDHNKALFLKRDTVAGMVGLAFRCLK